MRGSMSRSATPNDARLSGLVRGAIAAVALVVAAPAMGQAEDPVAVDTSPTNPTSNLASAYKFDGVAPRIRDHRNFAMEFGFRSRMVSIPKSLMDVWYYDIEDDNWAYIERRPRIRGYALGVEWTLKGDSANGIFYAEFMDSQMKAGYWDDVEEPPDHLDGDFLVPSPGFGLVTFGANYAFEAHMIRTRDTQGRFGLSFLVGGGLGMGIMTGRLDRWAPDESGNPSYKLYLDGQPPLEDKRLGGGVYPIVDVNASLRFNFGDRVVFRTEGGLHTLVYYGASAGVMF